MVKEKPNSTRIYDKDGFRQRAACICVRTIDEDEVRVNSHAKSNKCTRINLFYRFYFRSLCNL